MKKLFVLLIILPFFCCAENETPKCLDSELGAEFSTLITKTTSLCTEDLSITFLDVVNDSRCPSDVTCIWAGFVQVKLDLQVNGQKSTVELCSDATVTGVPAQIEIESFRFTLVNVLPYPAVTAKIDGSKREVILTVEKIGS